MKFLVDAQLPHRLSQWLQAEGHDSVHTRDLPTGNRTGDTAINQLSMREQRTVITKDEISSTRSCFVINHTNFFWFQPVTSAIKSWNNYSGRT
jgi:predicted nuclease of predicted toxin-antitoxin system